MKHRIILYGLLLLSISIDSIAQKCGIIVDDNNRVGIAYSTISVLKKPNGTISDEQGRFCFELPNKLNLSDSIFISALGYENKTISVKQYAQFDTLFLKEKIIVLEEVIVKSKKRHQIRLGNFHKNWMMQQTSFMPNSNAILASRIENSKLLEGVITKLYYRLSPQKTDFIQKFRLRCRIYKNSEANIPTYDILNNNVIIDVNPDDKFIEIDLSSKNITFKEQYIWVGIQTVGYIDNNNDFFSLSDFQYGKVKYRKKNPNKTAKIFNISPSFLMNDTGMGMELISGMKYWNAISPNKNNVPMIGVTVEY
ncbi:MAG: carboxypeptidase-like regulatory domain-containing protein [Arcicella sp.]|nr:carboxypeptidase-like regulatory domain-containing protein [Arcicella sp.]